MADAPSDIQLKYKDCVTRISSNLSFLASCADKTKVTPAMPSIMTAPKDNALLQRLYEQLSIAIKVHAASLAARQSTQSPLSVTSKASAVPQVQQRVTQSPRAGVMSPPSVSMAQSQQTLQHQRQHYANLSAKQNAQRQTVSQPRATPPPVAASPQMATYQGQLQQNPPSLVQNSTRISPQYMQHLNTSMQYNPAQHMPPARQAQPMTINTMLPNDMYRTASPQVANPNVISTQAMANQQYQMAKQRQLQMQKAPNGYSMPIQQMPQNITTAQHIPRGYPVMQDNMYMMGLQNPQLQVQGRVQPQQQMQQPQYQMPQQMQQQQAAQMAYQMQMQQRMQQYPTAYDYSAYGTPGQ